MNNPRKVRRISRACDFCHQRSIRCRASEGNPDRCQNCVDFDQPCTYNRPQKRSKRQDLPRNEIHDSQLGVLENEPLIEELVDVFFEIVQPIFPFHHRPTFIKRLALKEHHNNRAFFANVAAVCGLAAGRLRDGASPREVRTDPQPFGDAARSSIPQELSHARGLDFMRTCAVMTLYELQDGRRDGMHHYLGMYMNLVTMDGLSDEARWPRDLTSSETEERRCLFWSMYTLEVFRSVAWGGIIRQREAHCRVRYPSEIDNEESEPRSPNTIHWIHGWNFTTELYKVLEHIMDAYPKRSEVSGLSASELFQRNRPPQSVVMNQLITMYNQLPQRFKEMHSGAAELSDQYSFQAANIAATFQLVRIILCATESNNVENRVQTCNEFLHSIYKVPPVYLKAISSPMLYHLSCIGTVLGSVVEGPLTQDAYLKVRETLLAMADLLELLEIGHQRAISSSAPLRQHITRIDNFVRDMQPLTIYPPTVPSSISAGEPYNQTSVTHLTPQMHNTSLIDTSFELQLPQELLDNMPWPLGLEDNFIP